MAVKRYDGSQWVTVAGKGDQGTSSSIATWVKTATGGETSVSGNDDSSQPLSYTVGQELVFINGTLQKRGSDYTATTGNSITGLTALAANDVVTVWTVNAFSVTGAIANTIVDAKGDLIVATGADTPGKLTAGTTGQVLTVDSTTGTGLKWATPAAGGKVLQVVQATYGVSTSVSTNTFSDTGLTASITPSAASSKVLVLISQPIQVSRDNIAAGGGVRLMRGSTFIFGDEAASAPTSIYNRTIASGTTTTDLYVWQNFAYLDSPSTTSSTSYKTQIAVEAAVNNAVIVAQHNSNDASIILMEIGA